MGRYYYICKKTKINYYFLTMNIKKKICYLWIGTTKGLRNRAYIRKCFKEYIKAEKTFNKTWS